MNPALMEMIAQARTAELRGAAASRWGIASDIPADTGAPVVTTAGHGPAGARRTIGWFLVRVGLQLALPRPQGASAR